MEEFDPWIRVCTTSNDTDTMGGGTEVSEHKLLLVVVDGNQWDAVRTDAIPVRASAAKPRDVTPSTNTN